MSWFGKTFTVKVSARRYEKGKSGKITEERTVAIRAKDEAKALVKAQKEVRKIYPPRHGWFEHSVSHKGERS